MKLTEPFIVNFLIFVPIILIILFKKKEILINKKTIIILLLFSIPFGFIEAAGIIFLRKASNFSIDKENCIKNTEIYKIQNCEQAYLVNQIPEKLYKIEFTREISTIIILISTAMLASKNWLTRLILFLWIFAIWDISYYIFLYIMIGWPFSFSSYDFLFLVPIPWYGQVWYPLLVSFLTIIVIIYFLNKRK